MPDQNDPDNVESPTVGENLPEAAEEGAEDEMVTEGISLSHDERGRTLLEAGSLISGCDFALFSIQAAIGSLADIPEMPLTLPQADIETPGPEARSDGDAVVIPKLNLDDWLDSESQAKLKPNANFYEFLEIMESDLLPKPSQVDVQQPEYEVDKETSPSKTGANIDVVHFPFPGQVNPAEYDGRERRMISDFERECRGWKEMSTTKALDLLAETEESYLTISHKKVKRLEIFNPSYKLISKDYKPQVAVVGKSYRVIVDVSSFNPENIVVHVVSDRINVYAKDESEDVEGYKFAELHKVYKVPDSVNKDEFRAHMLNPLKLLCICAPLKLSEQDENTT